MAKCNSTCLSISIFDRAMSFSTGYKDIQRSSVRGRHVELSGYEESDYGSRDEESSGSRSSAEMSTDEDVDEMEQATHLTSMSGASTSRWEATRRVGFARSKDVTPTGIDIDAGRFPCCLVWTALPGITACFPVIGHMGIADSRGVVYDFAGPYHIGVDALAFGRCLRYVALDPSRIPSAAPPTTGQGKGEGGGHAVPALTPAQAWDAALDAGCDVYSERMHNICCDNCHSHVARCLNSMGRGGYPMPAWLRALPLGQGAGNWTMVHLAFLMVFHGRWTSPCAALQVMLPFFLVLALILGLRYGLAG